MPDRESKFKPYSLGIVLVDKAAKSDNIQVVPIEELHLDNGLITGQIRKFDIKAPDHKGIKRSTKIEGGSMLVAKWIPYCHSNRMTAPDVIKNETVMIYRYADTDEYYWDTIFREPNIRRLETVCYAYGDLPSGLEPFDKSSSYWIEWDTVNKHVWLHTSTSDGEPFAYDVEINTGKGYINVRDSVGNYIELESNENTITAYANREICLEAPVIRFRCNSIERDSLRHSKYANTAADGEVNFSDPGSKE